MRSEVSMKPEISGVGLNLPFTGWGLQQSVELASRCEGYGYDAIWTSERNGWDAMAFAGALTQAVDIPVGIAVVSVFTRPPALVAMGAASLAGLSNSGFILGLGVSSPLITQAWMGVPYERPVQRMREYLTLVRAMLNGDKVAHHGRSVTVDGFRLGSATPGTAILAAALGPQMMALAGQLADGVILHMTPAHKLELVMKPARTAATSVGRSQPKSMMTVPVIVGNDLDSARRSLAGLGLTYAKAPAYAAHLERLGYGDDLRACLKLWDAGDRESAVERMNPELVSVFGVFGDLSSCRRQVAAYSDAGLDQVNLHFMHVPEDAEELDTWLRALAPAKEVCEIK